ncbi:MAG: hypothetical protein ACI857_001935 [Arenicella sp.]
MKSNSVGNLGTDENGFLWRINANQLCRFDGNEFEYFSDPSGVQGISTTFSQNEVTIFENSIYFAQEEYLSHFTDGNFSSFRFVDSIPFDILNDRVDKYGQFLDSDQKIWTKSDSFQLELPENFDPKL